MPPKDSQDAARAPGRLRVFSANLFDGRADPEALADLLHQHVVDVAAFQEFCREREEEERTTVVEGGDP